MLPSSQALGRLSGAGREPERVPDSRQWLEREKEHGGEGSIAAISEDGTPQGWWTETGLEGNQLATVVGSAASMSTE